MASPGRPALPKLARLTRDCCPDHPCAVDNQDLVVPRTSPKPNVLTCGKALYLASGDTFGSSGPSQPFLGADFDGVDDQLRGAFVHAPPAVSVCGSFMVSMTTSVDFTTATVSEPGARPRPRAASVLTSQTMRCGPH